MSKWASRNSRGIDSRGIDSIKRKINDPETDNIEGINISTSNDVIKTNSNQLVLKDQNGNRIKRNGEGSISEPIDMKKTKNELMIELTNTKKELQLAKRSVEINGWNNEEVINYQNTIVKSTLDESLKYNDSNFYDFIYDPNDKDLNGKKWSYLQYEMYISNIKPLLSYYESACVASQFASISHDGSTTFEVLGKLYPLCEFYISKEFVDKNKGVLKGIEIEQRNKLFPKLSKTYYSIPGFTDETQKYITLNQHSGGGDRGLLTSSLKLAQCFKFFKTYKIPTSRFDDAENLLDVLNSYKASKEFILIDEKYKFLWNSILDAIGHVYLERGTLPDKSKFTLRALKEWKNPEDFINDPKYIKNVSIISKSNINENNNKNGIDSSDQNSNSNSNEIISTNENNNFSLEFRIPRCHYISYNLFLKEVSLAVYSGKLPEGIPMKTVEGFYDSNNNNNINNNENGNTFYDIPFN